MSDKTNSYMFFAFGRSKKPHNNSNDFYMEYRFYYSPVHTASPCGELQGLISSALCFNDHLLGRIFFLLYLAALTRDAAVVVAGRFIPAHHTWLILFQVAGDVPWNRDTKSYRRGGGGGGGWKGKQDGTRQMRPMSTREEGEVGWTWTWTWRMRR